jgi:hypothetical protein
LLYVNGIKFYGTIISKGLDVIEPRLGSAPSFVFKATGTVTLFGDDVS